MRTICTCGAAYRSLLTLIRSLLTLLCDACGARAWLARRAGMRALWTCVIDVVLVIS